MKIPEGVLSETSPSKETPSDTAVLSEATSDPAPRKPGHNLRMIHITAVVLNGLYLLLYLIGLGETGVADIGVVVALLYLSLPIVNIVTLVTNKLSMGNSAIALNLVWALFGLLILAVNDDYDARVGAVIMMVTAGFTAIALTVDRGESWLSLFLERKRLEEKKKIESLDK